MSISEEERRTLRRQQLSRQEVIDRRKRVNRFKRMIVWTCIVMILIPILVCIFLLVKVHRLEKDIDNLLAMKESGQIVAQTDSSGNRYLLLAADANKNEDGKTGNEDGETQNGEETTTVDPETQPHTEPVTEDTYTGKRAYLTFDDGPSVNTIPILDVLDRYNIKGTFFVIGKPDPEDMKLYKEIVDRGSTLGLHSYSHNYEALYASLDSFASDLDNIHNLVLQATGVDVRLFRFPGGSSTTTNVVDMKDMIRYLNNNGYRYVDWNVSSEDATGKQLTGDDIANIVISEAIDCNSAYILMHDARGKESTVESLPTIIEQLQANGFKFYCIDDNTQNLIQHVKASSVE